MRNRMAFSLACSFMLAVAFTPAAHADDIADPKRPPAPELDLGDWDKPSAPVWMPTEIQRPQEKVKPVNSQECLAAFDRQASARNICGATIDVEFNVTPEGAADNIRIIQSHPEGVLTATAAEAVQCLKYPPASKNEAEGFRTELTVRFTTSDCSGN